MLPSGERGRERETVKGKKLEKREGGEGRETDEQREEEGRGGGEGKVEERDRMAYDTTQYRPRVVRIP